MSDFISRRDVMKRGGAIALGLVAPRWLSSIAEADILHTAQGGKATGDTKLKAEGTAEKSAGKVQNAVGGIKDAARGK